MSSLEEERAADRARAREYLAQMTEAEDREITEAALTDPDLPPLSAERLARMRPISEAEAADLGRRQRGRPKIASPKRLVSLRLDQEVIERYRASGSGWQSRVNDVLREHMPGE